MLYLLILEVVSKEKKKKNSYIHAVIDIFTPRGNCHMKMRSLEWKKEMEKYEQRPFPAHIYVQLDESKHEILAFSLFPFDTLFTKTASLRQSRVEHDLKKGELDSSVLCFNNDFSIVKLVPPKKDQTFYSLKELLEKKTIQHTEWNFEKEEKKESKPLVQDNLFLIKELRMLILVFSSENPFQTHEPFSQEWKLALDTFSFPLPRLIFIRAYITFTRTNDNYGTLHSISRDPIATSNRKDEGLYYYDCSPGHLRSYWNVERIESFPLCTTQRLSKGRRLFGTWSMYCIGIKWNAYQESFSFCVQRKKEDSTIKEQEKKQSYEQGQEQFVPLESFMNLEIGCERICKLKWIDSYPACT